MASFNKVILIGNLTRDPEVRYTSKGTAIAKLGLAINRNYRTESGEQREETTFVDVDAFGRQAETIGQYLRKGRPIMVEGRLKLDSWEDKQTGQKRNRLGVVLENFQFLDSGGAGGRGGEAGAPEQAGKVTRGGRPAGAAAAGGGGYGDVSSGGSDGMEADPHGDDEVPF